MSNYKKSSSIKLWLLVIILFAGVTNVFSQDGEFSINKSPLPAPTGFVNDYAGVIDAGTKQRLEQTLTALKQQTNPPVEIAVAIVKTTGERDIFDYSLAVSRGWKIGSKETDNPGALLFIAIDDRKYFTQVSRDLEDELPDGLVGSIQRQFLVPQFKKGNYAAGIEDTLNAYIKRIAEKQGINITGTTRPQTQPTAQPRRGGRSGLSGSSIFCFIVIGLILLLIFSRGGRGGGRGGGGGSGLGTMLLWGLLSGLSNSGGSSGSSSSGGWGGGSSGGGGFGGFGGGGDFGGGGAGGDW